MKKLRNSLILLSTIIFLSSCDDTVIYEENIPVENNEWASDDIKTFNFEIQDTISPLNLYINLRTTTDYPYSNLYIFLYSEYPDGYTDKDTLEFVLAESDGKWLGENTGTVIENKILISRGGSFTKQGNYTFKIQHAMREEILPEVIDVGFRVELMEQKGQ